MPIQSTPSRIVPKKEASLSIVSPYPTANTVRIRVTEAPQGSEIAEALAKREEAYFALYEGSPTQPLKKSFDKGGVYRGTIEYLLAGSSGNGPTFEGEVITYQGENLLGSESFELSVGQLHSMLLTNFGGDSATLKVMVWGDRIVATTVAEHGVKTPVLEKPSSPRATVAVENADLLAAVNALADVVPETGLTEMNTAFKELVVTYHQHLTVAHHTTVDDSNTIPSASQNPKSMRELATGVQKLRENLLKHAANIHKDPGGGPSADGKTESHPSVDSALVRYDSPGANPADPFSILTALVDVWVAYRDHQERTTIHSAAGNAPNPLPRFLELHRLFLAALATLEPVTPNTKHVASGKLLQIGFKDG